MEADKLSIWIETPIEPENGVQGRSGVRETAFVGSRTAL